MEKRARTNGPHPEDAAHVCAQDCPEHAGEFGRATREHEGETEEHDNAQTRADKAEARTESFKAKNALACTSHLQDIRAKLILANAPHVAATISPLVMEKAERGELEMREASKQAWYDVAIVRPHC